MTARAGAAPALAAAALLCAVAVFSEAAEERVRLTAVIGARTLISSDGRGSLAALASIASKNGVDLVAPTDHYLQRWEYGLPPFEGLLRTSLYRPCVFRAGPARYLHLVEKTAREFPAVLMPAGVEVNPASRWEGHPAKGGLVLRENERNLLLIGWEREEDLAGIPALYRPGEGRPAWRRWVLPLLLLGAGLALALRWPAGLVLAAVGLLATLSQRPFRRPPEAFASFSRNGYDAAQATVDHAAARGVLAVWTYPLDERKAESRRLYRTVRQRTAPFPEALRATDGTAGFAVFGDSGAPPEELLREWDAANRDWLDDRRRRPLWAFSVLGPRADGPGGIPLHRYQNLLESRGRDLPAAMEAMRAGRFAAAFQEPGHRLALDVWRAAADGGPAAAAGETLVWPARGGIRLRAEVRSEAPGGAHRVVVRVWRNGVAWREAAGAGRAAGDWPLPRPDGRGDIYRVHATEESGSALLGNPLFVRPEGFR
jgi:hypothetical protein